MASSSTPGPAEPLSQVPCGICRRQFSKYLCPKCNVPYCSLTCFRSEAHGDCSESFYRKEVEVDIKTAPTKTAEERLKMMDLLKRFEEDSLDDDGDIMKVLGDDGQEEDENDLAGRLGKVDLDSVPPEELWSMLTPEEREKFIKAVDDPNSDLAQQLFASEELENVRIDPWWEDPDASVAQEEEQVTTSATANSRLRKRYGKKPEMSICVPTSMVKPIPASSPSLLYNACALCVAYAFTTRHLAISPLSSSPTDATDVLSPLIPFLVERKSTLVYSNLSDVVTDLWSRFGQDLMTPQMLALLLRDAARLVRPSRVVEISPQSTSSQPPADSAGAEVDLETHPNADLFRVFSDLAQVFEANSITSNSAKSKPNLKAGAKLKQSHITHKLTFYTVHVLSTPSVVLDMLASEAVHRATVMESEANTGWSGEGVDGQTKSKREVENIRATANEARRASAGGRLIEEL
ncbi:hypothetical protein OE88DRAFT_1734950 [Heliocybe sulcata]|uniref:HIT-type domain-containing protein n=1 Tax=Heliocybe sulcata TaxID=5364 RepID=A0A5C3N3U6_9AGAM|nr:hypothetical protein OE88DRAFT_1734950 [Heliocybe sulcata]